MTETITTFKKAKDFEPCETEDFDDFFNKDRLSLQSAILDMAATLIETGQDFADIAQTEGLTASRTTILLMLQKVIDRFDSRLAGFKNTVNDVVLHFLAEDLPEGRISVHQVDRQEFFAGRRMDPVDDK